MKLWEFINKFIQKNKVPLCLNPNSVAYKNFITCAAPLSIPLAIPLPCTPPPSYLLTSLGLYYTIQYEYLRSSSSCLLLLVM